MTLGEVAAAVGISDRTLDTWMARARKATKENIAGRPVAQQRTAPTCGSRKRSKPRLWSCGCRKLGAVGSADELDGDSEVEVAQLRSAVTTGMSSRLASARQARSATESPWAFVRGRSRAISTQSASVSGSRISGPSLAWRLSAICCGSPPSAATFESVSAQLTDHRNRSHQLQGKRRPTDPRTTHRRRLEASRIDAGSASGTACGGLGCCFGSRGGAPLSDQLVGVRAGGIAAEQSAQTLGRGAAALDLRVRLLDVPCHR